MLGRRRLHPIGTLYNHIQDLRRSGPALPKLTQDPKKEGHSLCLACFALSAVSHQCAGFEFIRLGGRARRATETGGVAVLGPGHLLLGDAEGGRWTVR
jgi:hypothetical protein